MTGKCSPRGQCAVRFWNASCSRHRSRREYWCQRHEARKPPRARRRDPGGPLRPASRIVPCGRHNRKPNRVSVTQPAEISATEPDWSREAKRFWSWHPSRSLLASIRCYQRLAGRRSPWSRLISKVAVLRHLFWSTITGSEIPINLQIGGGLLMPHPNGIVINSGAKIGPNSLIFQQVTSARRKRVFRLSVGMSTSAPARRSLARSRSVTTRGSARWPWW